jgi:hypothetical protein
VGAPCFDTPSGAGFPRQVVLHNHLKLLTFYESRERLVAGKTLMILSRYFAIFFAIVSRSLEGTFVA